VRRVRSSSAAWICTAIAILLSVAAVLTYPLVRTPAVASRLSDEEFWRLVTESSEAEGFFGFDNFTSNELVHPQVVSQLVPATPAGRVYLGVGPEQNFTYIAAIRPSLAVIFDIRRGNLQLQLMYKAIFELSNDRADFVAMLFSKPRPSSVSANATVDQLFAAFAGERSSPALYELHLQWIRQLLTIDHRLPLSAADLDGIEYVFRAFAERGFAVRAEPTYDELMTATDRDGFARSFLSSEETFNVVKAMEANNLVLPVVADFAGPTAIRAIAAYLNAHRATIGAFYLSNVEQYLPGEKQITFCRNVATLPLDASSTFIRSTSQPSERSRFSFAAELGAMQAETRRCS
jgi:hypothetical protein